jgi:hypothetical protein
MISLLNFFRIQFDDASLSDERIVKFAQVHLARLSQNNPGGKYTTLITATTTKTGALSTVISEKHFLHSEREGTTKTVDQLIADFIDLAQKTEKFISYTFGADSAAYQDFYPHGFREYSKMNKTNALELMTNMEKACLKHAAELPGDFAAPFSETLTLYTVARTAQQEKVGAIEGKQDAKSTARAELERQLQTNLLTLALDYMGQPDRCTTYFELSLLKPYHHKKRGNGEPVPTDGDTDTDAYVKAIMALTTFLAEFRIAPGETYTFYNPGEVTLSIYAALTEDAPLPESAIAIAPGEEKTLTVEDLGPAGSTFLLINNSTTTGGSIEISLI